MKPVVFSVIALVSLLMPPVDGHTQRPGTDIDRIERLDSDAARYPESPSRAPLHRHENILPKSQIPPRSPDLGEPYFPLSPSLGPGSGLLGPDAGRGPARLRSGEERDERELSNDR